MFVFLSRYVIFNILLSIFVCAAASLFFVWLVSVHVFAPYIIAFNIGTGMIQCYVEDVAVLGECYPSGRDCSCVLAHMSMYSAKRR